MTKDEWMAAEEALNPTAIPPAGRDARPSKSLRVYQGDVLRAAEANHIWLNAFKCIRPTPEFCEQVGREVLRMLDDNANTHVSMMGRRLGLPSQRELIVRINKS